jgi:hypothetical protein
MKLFHFDWKTGLFYRPLVTFTDYHRLLKYNVAYEEVPSNQVILAFKFVFKLILFS